MYYGAINEAFINSMDDWEFLETRNVLIPSGNEAWKVMLGWAEGPFLSG